MYILLAVCLSLAAFLVINGMASMLAAILWRAISRKAESWRTSTRAQFLFVLRTAPGLGASFCVLGLLIPAYLANEPRQTKEIVTAELGALAVLSVAGIGLAVWRRLATWHATRRLLKDWLRHAEPVRVDNVKVPVFRLQHQFPVLAVVGAMRPKLFIADQVFRSLEGEELSAAMAHENGHLIAGDNLKRGLLRACRDLLAILPLGRSLDRAWDRAAESAADEYAARSGASTALNLASALVKVARLVPRGCRPATFAGASLIAEDPGSIASRVLRLTQLARQPHRPPQTAVPGSKLALVAGLSGVFLAMIAAISSPQLLGAIHSALEYVVSTLQ
jgi:Zn-dependent protease with chaperone function